MYLGAKNSNYKGAANDNDIEYEVLVHHFDLSVFSNISSSSKDLFSAEIVN